jgi:hypothetical protein
VIGGSSTSPNSSAPRESGSPSDAAGLRDAKPWPFTGSSTTTWVYEPERYEQINGGPVRHYPALRRPYAGPALSAEPSAPASAGAAPSDTEPAPSEARALAPSELPRPSVRRRVRCPSLGALKARAAAVRLPLVYRQWRERMEPLRPQPSRWGVRHPAGLSRFEDGEHRVRLGNQSVDASAVDGPVRATPLRLGMQGEGVSKDPRMVLAEVEDDS